MKFPTGNSLSGAKMTREKVWNSEGVEFQEIFNKQSIGRNSGNLEYRMKLYIGQRFKIQRQNRQVRMVF